MKSNMLIVLAAFLLFGQTACSLIDHHSASGAVPSIISEADSDGDFVSDEVERQIGTNPRSRDYDTDNDGVPNYLEYNGYTYDWKTGKFAPWDGNPAVRHWRTDPTQWSTDQDAFPDGMEASGALMDVTVQEPGDDPLVPAYPDIVVRLESYAVTLNEDISYTDGGSLAKGSTWNRETAQTSSRSVADTWQITAQTTVAWPPEATISASYGQTYTNTQTTSTAVSVGKSILDESNWSCARTSNPTTAAQLKLRLKVHNYGTACASNIIPTLTLRIGGINVATFEPGNAQINMLPPGGQYPPDRGVYWVVDSIDTGVGVTPLYLTLDELRALERGAPVSLTVTQLKADVMLKNRSGEWTNAGDCGEYLARCEAVGANIQIEIGDGSFVHHLVYADDAPSAPRVTLGDALTSLGVRPDRQFHYHDTKGISQVASIDGYTFVFDKETLRRNGWDMNVQPPKAPESGFDMADMVLGPGTSVLIRSPRKPSEKRPTIHYASADPQTRVVQACVSDYDGISRVDFLAKEGANFIDVNDQKSADTNDLRLVMREDIPGSGFFSLVIPDSQYVFNSTEQVIATNLAGQDANQPVEIVYHEPPSQPEKPIFNQVRVDKLGEESKFRLYANVTNPDPKYPIKWVKVFYTDPQDGSLKTLDCNEPVNSYEDPNGWVLKEASGIPADIKFVAYVQPGVYAESYLESWPQVNTALTVRFDWYDTWDSRDKWVTEGLDVDTGDHKSTSWTRYPVKFDDPLGKKKYEVAAFCTQASSYQWRLHFNVPFVRLSSNSGDAVDFNQIKKDEIESKLSPKVSTQIQDPNDYSFDENDIFLFRSTKQAYVKLQVLNLRVQGEAGNSRRGIFNIRYIVYPGN